MKKLITVISFLVSVLHINSQCQILVNCGEKNDLITTLEKNNIPTTIFGSIDDLLSNAKNEDVVMILAQNYPYNLTSISEKHYEIIKSKNLHAFIEFPEFIPGIEIEKIRETMWERGVITDGEFFTGLDKMSLLTVNNCFITPVKVDKPLMVLARIAGYDKAVYGLENTETFPLLFYLPVNKNIIIATSKFSNFIKGRYGPQKTWETIWVNIINKLFEKEKINELKWERAIGPRFNEKESLNKGSYVSAVVKGVEWISKGRFLIHPDWKETWWLKYQGDGTNPFGPELDKDLPVGDGSLGILEGHASKIYWNGKQQYRYWVRNDCCAESAMTFAIGSCFFDSAKNKKIASNLLDFIYYNSNLRQGPRNNPNSSSFGLIGWALTHPNIYYGDDNARALLGSIVTSSVIKNMKWDEFIIQGILANYRTSSYTGFRALSLDDSAIERNKNWQGLLKKKYEVLHPHFESWIWANYLWLYDKTKYKPLLTSSRNAIRVTMEGYPDKWSWTNGIQQERARMILPLAWLVRVEDNPQHRQWLEQIINDLLRYQQDCGGIIEQLGGEKVGMFGANRSNSDYGRNEAPLIQQNGDPVVDMLYTTNFAVIGLTEAYRATSDSEYGKALNKMIDFLVRIQCKSELNPSIDGAWFRAFDFNKWDYWASNADLGWGAWCTMTGWTQSWIVTSIALHSMNTSLWEITNQNPDKKTFSKNLEQMLPIKEIEKIYIEKLFSDKTDSIEAFDFSNTFVGDNRFDKWNINLKKILSDLGCISDSCLVTDEKNVFMLKSKDDRYFYLIYSGKDNFISLKNDKIDHKAKIKILGKNISIKSTKENGEIRINIPEEIVENDVVLIKLRAKK